MVNLIALAPCAGILPCAYNGITLSEVTTNHLLSVAPFAGKNSVVSAALKDQVGNALPAANRRAGAVTWFGHGTFMVAGEVALDGLAAVSDQSDAWAVIQIAGTGVEAVLARLVPIDLRRSVFKKNHSARTMLGHMSVAIVRTGADTFEISVMRSMAATLVHDLTVAMRGVAARG